MVRALGSKQLCIAVWHNLPSGGGKRALYYHVRGLLERGYRVEAWCPSSADQTYLPLGEVVVEHIRPLDWRPVGTATAWSRLKGQYQNTVGKLEAMDRHCRQCADEINHGGFDLLLANSCMFFRASAIGRHVKIPSALYLQEPYRPLYEALPTPPWAAPPASDERWWAPGRLKRLVSDLVRLQALRVQVREEVRNAASYDVLLVNSLFSRESVLRAYGLDAAVCYLGVDTAAFVDRDQARENFVVGLGALDANKNPEFVIEALGLVPEPRPPLVWIGDRGGDANIEPLRRLAARHKVGFEARIRVSDQELVDTLNRASLMVYAPRLEPFGFAPLEAGACGLPVVAVAEGGVRETVVDGVNGLLVEHSAEAMAAAIKRLLDDRPYARALGKNGRELVERKWSVDAAVDRLEQRLLEVLRANPHRSRCL